MLWGFKPAAIFGFAIYGQGRKRAYRRGRGARRLRAGFGSRSSLPCHLPLPRGELDNFLNLQLT